MQQSVRYNSHGQGEQIIENTPFLNKSLPLNIDGNREIVQDEFRVDPGRSTVRRTEWTGINFSRFVFLYREGYNGDEKSSSNQQFRSSSASSTTGFHGGACVNGFNPTLPMAYQGYIGRDTRQSTLAYYRLGQDSELGWGQSHKGLYFAYFLYQGSPVPRNPQRLSFAWAQRDSFFREFSNVG